MKLWQRLSKRGKVTATISIVVILAGLGVGGYYLRNHFISADVITTRPMTDAEISATVDSGIGTEALSATAAVDNIKSANLGLSVNQSVVSIATNINSCFASFSSKKLTPDTILAASGSSGTIGDISCTFSFKKTSYYTDADPTYAAIIDYSKSPGSATVLPTSYKDTTTDNNATESVKKQEIIKLKTILNYSKNANSWFSNPFEVSGSFDENITSDLRSGVDLLSRAKGFGDVDPGSSWISSVEGNVNLNLAGNFDFTKHFSEFRSNDDFLGFNSGAGSDNTSTGSDSGDITLTKADFCPNTCQIKVGETLDIKSKPKNGDYTGDMVSKAKHTDIYNGVGGYNPDTKSIYWKSLTVDKTDERSWDYNLTWKDTSTSHYTGKTSSKENSDVLKTNVITADSNIVKDLTVLKQMMIVGGSAAAPHPVPATLTTTVHTDKIERNKNGTITRSGNSTYSQCMSNQSCPTQVGVFDSNGSDVLIISPPNPNQPRVPDPLNGQDLTQYTMGSGACNSGGMCPGGVMGVPGFFTASYNTNNNLASISTGPAKLLPKNIYIWEAGGSGIDSRLYKPFVTWANALGKYGVKVTIQDTSDKKSLLSAINSVESGSWVINIGHGVPDGLSLGLNTDGDPFEFISYEEISRALNSKKIRLDLFGGISCYAGRASISDTVVGGMMSVAINGSNTLSNMIGIGTASWDATVNDLLATLQKIGAAAATCSAGTTTTGSTSGSGATGSGSGSNSGTGGTTGGSGTGDTSGTGSGSGTTSGTSGGTTSTSGSTSGSGTTLNSTGGTTTTSTSGTDSGSTTHQTITTTTGSPIVPITNPNVSPVTTPTQFSQNNVVLSTNSSGQTTVTQITSPVDTTMMQAFTPPQAYQVSTPSLNSQLLNLVSNNSNTSMALTGQTNPSLLTKIGALFSAPTTKIEVVATPPPIANSPVYIINGVPMQSTNTSTIAITTAMPKVIQLTQTVATFSVISSITKTSPTPSQAMMTQMMMIAVAPR